jgi:hypothetical protein
MEIGDVVIDADYGVVTVEEVTYGGYYCRDEFDEVVFIEAQSDDEGMTGEDEE